MVFRKVLLMCLLCVSVVSNASDIEKEKRWAEQISDTLMDGDEHYLSDGTNEFLALITENSEGFGKLGAVVMHGVGVHPDWEGVIQPIRVELAESGWHTASIQMPVLPNDAESEEYTPLFKEVPGRIDAAIDYLKDELGVERVVLIAHSLGSAMTNYYLGEQQDKVDGFIAIGMGPGLDDPVRDNHRMLKKVTIPTLDLYGAEDLPAVVEHAKDRAEAQQHNDRYVQIKVDGADHFFDGEEEVLLNHVKEWLTKLVSTEQ